MKRSTARWTTAFAAAACIALPAAGWSQTPPATPSPTPTTQQPAAGAHAQHGAAQEHIRQAQAALKDVPASVPARAKARISELKRHLNALEKSGAVGTTGTKTTTARSKSNWGTEVAAIDKILTELLGSATTSGATEPTGATGTAGTGTTKSRSTAALTLDEATKTKLMEVRTHVTAYAAAMSGGGAATPRETPSEPAADPSAAAATQPRPAASPAQAAPTGGTPEQAQPPAASAQVDAEGAKRHLTAARDTLSQLTQLPAAAQLTGDARTNVSQLITNFNELITATADWRGSYDKVNGNLTALIGAESAAEPQAPPTGTPGAVGTAGAVTLDPAIRAKLVEFRNHLTQFQKAAAGDSAMTPEGAPSPAAASGGAAPSPSTSMAGSPASTTPAEQSAAQQQQPQQQRPAAMGQDNAVRHIEAIEAILSGRSAAAPGSSPSSPTGASPTGATPTGTPTGSTPTGGTPTGTPPSSSSSSTAGTTGAGPASVTLDRAQLEQIRMHLSELRKAVERK